MSHIPRISLLATVVALVAACAGGTSGSPDEAAVGPDESPPATATADASTSPPAEGDSSDGAGNADVLAFTAPTLDGGTFDAADYAGRDVILWMWAPW